MFNRFLNLVVIYISTWHRQAVYQESTETSGLKTDPYISLGPLHLSLPLYCTAHLSPK